MEDTPKEQHEREPQTTPNPFDLSILNDEQIEILNCALTDYYANYALNKPEDEVFEDLFNTALVTLAEQDPDRGRQLLQHLATNDKWQSREAAAYFAGSFGTIDVEFATQMLIGLKRRYIQRDRESEPDDHGLGEAVDFGSDSLRKHMTPEQAADFDRRMGSLWRESETSG